MKFDYSKFNGGIRIFHVSDKNIMNLLKKIAIQRNDGYYVNAEDFQAIQDIAKRTM